MTPLYPLYVSPQPAPELHDAEVSAAPHTQEWVTLNPREESEKMPQDLSGQKIVIIGLGRSGRAAATLACARGAEVLILDDHKIEHDNLSTGPLTLHESIEIQTGHWSDALLMQAQSIVISPGVPMTRLPLTALKDANIPVIAEVEFAAQFIKAPIIGITGTNGKSTTTCLVGAMLKQWGLTVFVGGNLGQPLSEAVGHDWDFVVAELSSFQLDGISSFRPRIAAFLNLSPDHLDRYENLEAYQQAKWRIFENQEESDQALINFDAPRINPTKLNAKTLFFSRTQVVPRGVFLESGEIKSNVWGEVEHICALNELQAGLAFHPENLLAATAIAQLCGTATEDIAACLKNFKGLPHRMEWLRKLRGVSYFNDSKGTNIGAVLRALEAMRPPITLIAGGQDKSGDFSPLRDIVQHKVRHLILFGSSRDMMARCFEHHPHLQVVETLEEAVPLAANAAGQGECVVLSPGCASFDQFENFEHRGQVFRALVEKLQ